MTTFLSGPASVFGVPSRKACEMLVDQINAAGGLAGVPMRAFFVDEAPGTDHLVGEFRRLVQSEGVHAMFQSISSGSCLACTPLSAELQKLTILWDCGTSASSRRTLAMTPSAPRATHAQVLPRGSSAEGMKNDFRTSRDNQDYAGAAIPGIPPPPPLWKAGMDSRKPRVRVVAECSPLRLDRLLDRDHPPAGGCAPT